MSLDKSAISHDITLPSGTRIRYYEYGPTDGYPVLLLHGSGPGATGWSNFSGNIEQIGDAGFRVIAPDMPGWGASDPVATDDLDHAASALEFLDAMGIEKAAFVGNSMGGHTSIRFATLHPDRISHLMTMGPPLGKVPSLNGVSGLSEGLKVLIETYVSPTEANMKRLVEVMTFDNARFATPELIAARTEATNAVPEHVQNYVEGLPKGSPIPVWVDRDKVGDIRIPALFIHGKDDRVVPFENSLWLLANVLNSRAVLLNQCGHWAMIEHAEEFNRLVIDFVANN
ncbi:MAG: alpha/beta hydrolase [Propionibacteriaceae bacterium]|nr:alpha/beta hydrolase [Propionibacteriaceae bacterium]